MPQQRLRPIYARTRGAKWRHRFNVLLILVVVAAIGWGGIQWFHLRQAAVVKGFNVRGIAVSQDDGYLDFDGLQKDGLRFVYLKATQGASYTDDNFASSYSRVLGTSLGVGVYHVFSFSTSGRAQASYFERTVNNNVGNLPIAIQVQYYGQYTEKTLAVKKVQRQLRALVLRLTNQYQRTCVIWTTPTLAKQVVKPVIKQTPLWLDTTKTHQRSSRIMFMHYSNRALYRQNGTSQEFTGLIFNGNEDAYQKVIAKGLN
ncbi:GH25 family lysozyme [Lactiplantibacillus mudanjiangensis]|uniref:Lysozyme [Lactobacillus sp.] n=1 Tax=Lactiplantibacillus mudanjiangensis TaxID=1296538 RepID=A0A660E1I6_9LACO|nr:GH25 family lysozyme [Lactiplantibacillus mudanjiangensis]VDG23139.1 lysozyme [Lactobacillus sp.] [Lactiplantibacillus mudanjiangensis]VDG29588.1 lysozyme [Lactobacillus sp.] [Lactiplantibacillus mudanjiangensis]